MTPRKSSIMLSHNFVRRKFMDAFHVQTHLLRALVDSGKYIQCPVGLWLRGDPAGASAEEARRNTTESIVPGVENQQARVTGAKK